MQVVIVKSVDHNVELPENILDLPDDIKALAEKAEK